MATGWGFDTKELDPKVRPQDDFYHYVNRKWMRANPIPENESWWGSFTILRLETERKLKRLLTKLASRKGLKKNGPEQQVRDFYRSGMDMRRRNELGITPLAPVLRKIDRIASVTDLVSVIAYLHRIGVDVAWSSGVDQDAKRADRYAFHLAQGGLGLPDRDYYLKSDAESTRVLEAYKVHVEKLFRLMGRTIAEARTARDSVIALETSLARASMKKEDRRDPYKTYHKLSRAALRKLSPEVPWDLYLKESYADAAPYFIVMQPRFLAHVGRMLKPTSVEDWKTYLAWHVVNSFSSSLSAPFIRQSFSFYARVLAGTPKIKPLWRRVLGAVNGALGEQIGQLYVKRHFPPEAKARMLAMIEDLFVAYRARIKGLTWMSPKTKRKALKKLGSFNRKIGYPDKWKSYAGLRIAPDDYVGNIIRTNEYEHRRELRKLTKPIDRAEWFMYPQTVNAYFAPTLNDIVFPAAILQPPFFSLSADDAINYGCIGAVIGHEITHGFDDEGSKYDAKGNLKSWWTPGDRRKFNAKAKKVELQYNRYTVADGVRVNGKLTLGENIADFGGLSIAYDAYQAQLARTGRKIIDGLTPEERFFIAFALFERGNVRPEFIKTKVLTDPHSPDRYRINGPLANFEPFYDTYNVGKKDGLYRAPKDREMVW